MLVDSLLVTVHSLICELFVHISHNYPSHVQMPKEGGEKTKLMEPRSLAFNLTAFIVLGLIAGVLLAVIIYFDQIRQGNNPSDNEITSMLVICGILFAVAAILWIWSGVRLFVKPKTREAWTKQAYEAGSSESGFYERESIRSPETYKQRVEGKYAAEQTKAQTKQKLAQTQAQSRVSSLEKQKAAELKRVQTK